jgi:hypothetical protein
VHTAAGGLTVVPKFKKSAGALALLALNPDVVQPEAKKLLQEGTPLVFVLDTTNGRATPASRWASPSTTPSSRSRRTRRRARSAREDREGDGVYARADRPLAAVTGFLRVG